MSLRTESGAILATALAAVTAIPVATYLGSLLPVGSKGTMAGLFLGSVVSGTCTVLYKQWIARGHQAAAARVAALRRGPAESASSFAARRRDVEDTAYAGTAVIPVVAGRRQVPWRKIAWVSGGFAAAAVVLLTGFELAAGQPVAAIVHGQRGTGTTLDGSTTRRSTPPPATPAVTPAPAATTPLPSPSVSPDASPSPSARPSPAATPATSPAATSPAATTTPATTPAAAPSSSPAG